MPTQIDRVKQYYNSTVLDYKTVWTGSSDLAMHFGYYDESVKTHSQSLIKMNQVLAGLANISATDKVLDAGCGYGGSSLWLAKNIGSSAVGLTVVPYQVVEATKNAAELGLAAKVSFLEADYSHTNLPSGSFDVVWGLESIVHAESKPDFVKEAYRLLKPGGRLLIAEYMLRDTPPLSFAQMQSIKPWLSGWEMPNLLSPKQYSQIMAQAGFDSIETHDLTPNVEPSLKRLWKFLPIAVPLSSLLGTVKIINPSHRANVTATVCQRHSFYQKLWHYVAIIAHKPD